MIEIEKFECKDKNEALARERYWLESLQAKLNTVIPQRTKKEYDQQYIKDNKEAINEQRKQYRQDNKEVILERQRKYRRDNIDKIRERSQVKFTCDCGSTLRISDRAKHFRSLKHINFCKPSEEI
jgi:hypothetical protein